MPVQSGRTERSNGRKRKRARAGGKGKYVQEPENDDDQTERRLEVQPRREEIGRRGTRAVAKAAMARRRPAPSQNAPRQCVTVPSRIASPTGEFSLRSHFGEVGSGLPTTGIQGVSGQLARVSKRNSEKCYRFLTPPPFLILGISAKNRLPVPNSENRG